MHWYPRALFMAEQACRRLSLGQKDTPVFKSDRLGKPLPMCINTSNISRFFDSTMVALVHMSYMLYTLYTLYIPYDLRILYMTYSGHTVPYRIAAAIGFDCLPARPANRTAHSCHSKGYLHNVNPRVNFRVVPDNLHNTRLRLCFPSAFWLCLYV